MVRLAKDVQHDAENQEFPPTHIHAHVILGYPPEELCVFVLAPIVCEEKASERVRVIHRGYIAHRIVGDWFSDVF